MHGGAEGGLEVGLGEGGRPWVRGGPEVGVGLGQGIIYQKFCIPWLRS